MNIFKSFCSLIFLKLLEYCQPLERNSINIRPVNECFLHWIFYFSSSAFLSVQFTTPSSILFFMLMYWFFFSFLGGGWGILITEMGSYNAYHFIYQLFSPTILRHYRSHILFNTCIIFHHRIWVHTFIHSLYFTLATNPRSPSFFFSPKHHLPICLVPNSPRNTVIPQ